MNSKVSDQAEFFWLEILIKLYSRLHFNHVTMLLLNVVIILGLKDFHIYTYMHIYLLSVKALFT